MHMEFFFKLLTCMCPCAHSVHPLLCIVADHPSKSDLLQIALERFQDAKESMVMRFKNGKTDITIVVWDFGGQTVRSAHASKGN